MSDTYAIGEPVIFDGCENIGRITHSSIKGAYIKNDGITVFRKWDEIYHLHDYDDGPVVNVNCLRDMFCPKCGSLGPFDIRAECTVTMTDDGHIGAREFGASPDADCRCNHCGFSGPQSRFKE